MPITRRPLPRAAVSRAWLDVPYSDRNLVKRLGALWDPAARRWYAPVPGLPALRPWRRLPQSVPGEDRGYGQGLYADPIPASSWYRNVRSAVSARDWYRISQMTRRRAGWACESCGWQPDRADRDLLDAHERFTYDDTTGTQRLVRLISLCAACHGVTHFGYATVTGQAEPALRHLQHITGMTRHQALAHVSDALSLSAQRSQIPWTLDLTVISAAGVSIRNPRTGIS
jgi:hypothetical protein